jgi:glucose/arabinose dehydrogenase
MYHPLLYSRTAVSICRLTVYACTCCPFKACSQAAAASPSTANSNQKQQQQQQQTTDKQPPRFYAPQLPTSIGAAVQLEPDEARHAVRVLRLKQGDALELCDGRGSLVQCEVAYTEKNSATVSAGALAERAVAAVHGKLECSGHIWQHFQSCGRSRLHHDRMACLAASTAHSSLHTPGDSCCT